MMKIILSSVNAFKNTVEFISHTFGYVEEENSKKLA